MTGPKVTLCSKCTSFLLSALLLCHLPALTRSQTIAPPNPLHCVTVTSTVCDQLGWNGSLPNVLDMNVQSQVDEELEPYLTLYATGCSNAMLHFICAVYYPPCYQQADIILQYPPCRQLCEYVQCTCLEAIQELGAEWPQQLECSRFALGTGDSSDCLLGGNGVYNDLLQIPLPEVTGRKYPSSIKKCGIPPPGPDPPINGSTGSIPPTTITAMPSTAAPPPSCIVSELDVYNRTSGSDRYHLGRHQYCGMQCSGRALYGDSADALHIILPVVILTVAAVGAVLSLFTIATFLIDRRRFPYPERPMVYLSIAKFMLATCFIVATIAKLVGFNIACTLERNGKSFAFQELPNLVDPQSTVKAGTCTALAVFIYYASMASLTWWAVLAFTWFLAAVLKWAEEAVSRFWMLYHVLAWGIPLLQLIILLSLHQFDGEALVGICYVGHFNAVSNGIGVFGVTIIYVVIATVLTILSLVAMMMIRHQLPKTDQEQRSKITRLILRLAVFSASIFLPNFILLLLHIYQLSAQEHWELVQLCSAQTSRDLQPASCRGLELAPPTAAYLFLKYLLWVGLCSSTFVWVVSKKTLYSWKRLVLDIVSGLGRRKSAASTTA
uniref:FzdE n=1 Tax=Halisarca dujardinii TaxID=2583056 RepID=A0A8F8FKA1_HALDU|nr:frizzled E HduFzdE [Halisarca dujardinii]